MLLLIIAHPIYRPHGRRDMWSRDHQPRSIRVQSQWSVVQKLQRQREALTDRPRCRAPSRLVDDEGYKNSNQVALGLNRTITSTTPLWILFTSPISPKLHNITMKVLAGILAIAAITSAAATPNMKRQTVSSLCGPLDTPQCCGTDVLGVADLSCSAGMSQLAESHRSPMLNTILQF